MQVKPERSRPSYLLCSGASEQIVNGLPRDPELPLSVGHGVALVQELA